MQSMNVNELDQLLCDSFRQLLYIKAITPITLSECEEVVQDEVNSSISRKIPTIEVEALAKLLFIKGSASRNIRASAKKIQDSGS